MQSSSVPTSGSALRVGTPAADTIDGLAGSDESSGSPGMTHSLAGRAPTRSLEAMAMTTSQAAPTAKFLTEMAGLRRSEGGGKVTHDALYGGDGDDLIY